MVKTYDEIPKTEEGDFTLPKLSELRNETFIITNIRYGEADIGAYAVVEVEGVEYRTFSKVLLKQLKDIEAYMDAEKDTVEVTLKRVGDYHTFA